MIITASSVVSVKTNTGMGIKNIPVLRSRLPAIDYSATRSGYTIISRTAHPGISTILSLSSLMGVVSNKGGGEGMIAIVFGLKALESMEFFLSFIFYILYFPSFYYSFPPFPYN